VCKEKVNHQENNMAVKKVKALSVTSSREGFRRAGHSFGREAKVIPLTDLSKNQIGLLKGEGFMAVTEVEIESLDE
jgi:hypothetical protein